MNYDEKKAIANEYLSTVCGLSWDDLPDINSLHDADDKEDIIQLCKDRLSDEGFILDGDILIGDE